MEGGYLLRNTLTGTGTGVCVVKVGKQLLVNQKKKKSDPEERSFKSMLSKGREPFKRLSRPH